MYRGDSAKGLSPEVPTTWTVLPAQVQPGKGVSAAPFSLLSGRGDKDAHRLDPGRGEEQRTFGLRLKEEQTITIAQDHAISRLLVPIIAALNISPVSILSMKDCPLTFLTKRSCRYGRYLSSASVLQEFRVPNKVGKPQRTASLY